MKDLEYSSAETSGSEDWLESIKDIEVSAFIESTGTENSVYTKTDFELDLKKVCSPK